MKLELEHILRSILSTLTRCTINKNILGLQLSQIGMCTLVDLTMKLKKLTLQGPLYPGNNFFNELI
jgi:hypothetical protein